MGGYYDEGEVVSFFILVLVFGFYERESSIFVTSFEVSDGQKEMLTMAFAGCRTRDSKWIEIVV